MMEMDFHYNCYILDNDPQNNLKLLQVVFVPISSPPFLSSLDEIAFTDILPMCTVPTFNWRKAMNFIIIHWSSGKAKLSISVFHRLTRK